MKKNRDLFYEFVTGVIFALLVAGVIILVGRWMR